MCASTRCRYTARDINLIEFGALGDGPLPGAEAGAHIDVHLPNGLVRQYSLTNPGSTPRSYVIGVKRDANSRGGSKFMFDELRVGDVLKIGRPRNNFVLNESASNSVLIAGELALLRFGQCRDVWQNSSGLGRCTMRRDLPKIQRFSNRFLKCQMRIATSMIGRRVNFSI
jgi:hypothetical protein